MGMKTPSILRILFLLLVPLGMSLASGQVRSIDSSDSKMIVHVAKAGVFSAFGDNHEIEAPISQGSVDEAARRVTLVVDARRMKVLDPQLSADKRQQVQERMLGADVLDVARFPVISFDSTSVEQRAPGQLLVEGQLKLHGQTHAVSVNVRSENGHYIGTCKLKQRDFGITPVSVAGGTVKVKDELTIEFDVQTSATALQ